VWYVKPETEAREKAMASREAMGGFLQDRRWMRRVLDRTYDSINTLAEWGYPFPSDEVGKEQRSSLQGPEYMRLMRRRVRECGVKILDQSPALELLVDESGAVAGARGWRRQQKESWAVRAKVSSSGSRVTESGECAVQRKMIWRAINESRRRQLAYAPSFQVGVSTNQCAF